MTYQAVLERTFSLSKKKGMNCSLSNIKRLCEIHNHPELAFPTIHVAGTNGKGSVCTKIASALQQAGWKVGLYTSPHISTFRERIRINGEPISEVDISELFAQVKWNASFFEIATLIAFLYFRNEEVDVAVIETGLGGTWDATNVVMPLVSIITSIGLDHTELLGNSLDQIALEKAGIIKKGIPVVLGPDLPSALLRSIARERGSPAYQSCHRDRDYDRENQETARIALDLLRSRFQLTNEAIDIGLQAKPPCRFERHQVEGKTVIFDVAHNSHGFARLLEKLDHRSCRFIVGFSADKDIAPCARLIESKADAIHLVSAPHPRLASVDAIQPAFSHPHLYPEETIAEAVRKALQSSEEIIVITGSFFIMQAARKACGIQEPSDPVIWYDPYRVKSE
jgi:dihydrofolate synthase/folylpolyglutamate synthase